MKYALKALIEVANKTEEFAPAHVIAERGRIPFKFLEQILTDLRKGRILSSKKGNAGGYYFVKDPKNITLADVYRLIDGPIALISCASLNFYEPCSDCPDESVCAIHHALVFVRNETLKTLEKITIADLANGSFTASMQTWVI